MRRGRQVPALIAVFESAGTAVSLQRDMLGSADVVILQKVAPKATRIELNDVASTALAVSSGRADAMVTAVFGALVAKNRNPGLGDFVLPTPVV